MAIQYLRSISLSVADDTDRKIDLSELHIQFDIFSATVSSLKRAEIRVWNLGRDKSSQILKEFTTVSLSVGYNNGDESVIEGVIFEGQIARVEVGRDNAVDSFVKIFAQDGDEGKNWSITSATLQAGWTDDDVYRQLMADWSVHGITPGAKPSFTTLQGSRGKTMFGPTASFMTELAIRQKCDWFIEDGKVNLVPKNSSMPTVVIPTLTPKSGLIGVPTLTFDGIQAKCLINPQIKTGGLVRIDNSAITQLNQKFVQAGVDNPSQIVPDLDGGIDGIGTYKSHCVTHSGDTRGNDWYTTFIAVAVDGTGPNSGPATVDVPSGN